MSNELAKKETSSALAKIPDAEVIEQAVIAGDLSGLSSEMRVVYYHKVCESVGLNPLTKPFEFVTLNGKKVLYPNKGCAEQLRKINKVSIEILSRTTVNDVYTVEVKGTDKDGKWDTASGSVGVKNLAGDELAKAMMKAETKAKRRLTFSICGLGMEDHEDADGFVPPVVVTQPVTGPALPAAVNSQVLTGQAPPDPFEGQPAPAKEEIRERIAEAVAKGDENARKTAGRKSSGRRSAPAESTPPGVIDIPPPSKPQPPPPSYVASPDDVDF